MPKPRPQSGCLIEKSLIVHSFFRWWLSLTEGYLFWDVPIVVTLFLGFLDTSSLHSILSDNFSPWLSTDSISFTLLLLDKSILIWSLVKHSLWLPLSPSRVRRTRWWWSISNSVQNPSSNRRLLQFSLFCLHSLSQKISLLFFGFHSHLPDLFFFFDGLSHFQGLLDLGPFLGLFPGLSLSCVKSIDELSVSLVYCSVL